MRDKIMSGSRMAKKCQKCKYKDDCQNKRLEAFNYIIPKEIEIKINPPTTNVNINNLDINELTKQIEKKFEESLLQIPPIPLLNYCYCYTGSGHNFHTH